MSKIKSVDNSYGNDGKNRHFVTVENPDGSSSQIEVNKEEAERFQRNLKEHGGGKKLLTETDPYTA